MPSSSLRSSEPTPSNEWIRRHYARIHRAAWVMTGDTWEAEDLAQETFVVALDRWDHFRGHSSEETWLFGILIRLRQRRGRMLARARRRLERYADQLVRCSDGEDPQRQLSQQQWRESIWAQVAKLPRRQRDAVTLRFAEGLSYEQIAKIVNCPPGTAKTRVHHGVRRLRLDSDSDQQLSFPENNLTPAVNATSRS